MKVLIADDEKNIRDALVKLLKPAGWEAEAVENGRAAQRKLQEEPYDAVIADLKMPGMSGLDLLQWCTSEGPDVPFVMISAHGEIRDAVQAMKLGARDYLTKPFDPDELEFRLKQALETHRSVRIAQTWNRTQSVASPESSASSSSKIDQILAKAAPTTSLILILGESGTGKEVLARRIHDHSGFSDGPFVPINVGGIPETLLESELFGYEKGAFTGAIQRKTGLFEVAAGGTLFLDEIGEMPSNLQVKLLRVLQERKIQRLGGTTTIPVQARILAATNRNLAEEVKAGRFREDLYYRLNVVPIQLLPLRDRKDDLPRLCSELIDKLSRTMGKKAATLSPLALERLKKYDFPGNIRELENLLERALIFCEGDTIRESDIDVPDLRDDTSVVVEKGTLRDWERTAIQQALLRWEGHQTKAAEELGISRRTLFNKIKEYRLDSQD